MPLHTPQDIARMYGSETEREVFTFSDPSDMVIRELARYTSPGLMRLMLKQDAKPSKKPKPSKGGKKGAC